MKKQLPNLVTVLAACLMCFGTSTVASTKNEYLELSVRYSRGDFGSTQTTRQNQLQLSYGKFYEDFDFSLSTSYIQLKDELGNDSGIGDVFLRAGSIINKPHTLTNELYLSMEIKLPTADEATGLGTGEPNLSGYLNFTHKYKQSNFTVTGGYSITGDNATQTYNDIFLYGAGISTYFNQWYLYGRMDGQQQMLNTGDNPLEINAGLFYQVRPTYFIKADGFKGLNDASPDIGFGLGLVHWF